MRKQVKIYTDGACSGNPGPGGYGAILMYGDNIKEISGGEANTTNNKMELMAAIVALEVLKEACDVELYSDSAYFVNCYNDKWYINWENNGWINSKREPIANKDLWEKIIPYFKNPYVHIEKVKGHSGHVYNELADKLATGALKDDADLKIDEKNDKINIELSEILLDYSMRKYPVDETIKRIRKACNCG